MANDPDEKLSKLIRDCYEYDAETGDIIYRVNRGTNKVQGKVAGSVNGDGYIRVSVSFNGKQRLVFAHRIAWFLHYGTWPSGEIDHINRVKSDNRIDNLRDIERQRNLRNFPRRKNSKAVVTGVAQLPSGNWRATVQCKKQKHYLGVFHCLGHAIKARRNAVKEMDFTNHHGSVVPQPSKAF